MKHRKDIYTHTHTYENIPELSENFKQSKIFVIRLTEEVEKEEKN